MTGESISLWKDGVAVWYGAGMGAEGDKPDWLEYLDHTADVGIRVTAPSLGHLFERAAWGMMSLVTV